MIEVKKCARCGGMYISENEVCDNCLKKDGADMVKLKGYLNGCEEVTKGEISAATGIINKNLSRLLTNEEFKDINIIPEKAGDALNNANRIEL